MSDAYDKRDSFDVFTDRLVRFSVLGLGPLLLSNHLNQFQAVLFIYFVGPLVWWLAGPQEK